MSWDIATRRVGHRGGVDPDVGDRLPQRPAQDQRADIGRALMHLAARLPAAVLAEVLNLTPGTAVDWVRATGGDWSSYAAQVVKDRDREMR